MPQVIKDFASSTTIHGLNKLVNAKHFNIRDNKLRMEIENQNLGVAKKEEGGCMVFYSAFQDLQ